MADTTDTSHSPECMLTTYDNPFDPFTEWDEWYSWDQNAGYHTPGLLDRVARTSDELSDADQHLALRDAMDEIVRENVSGVHRKVKRGDVQAIAKELGT
jgi:hypothetical protein